MGMPLDRSHSEKKYYISAFVLGCIPFLLSVLSFIIQNSGVFYYYGDFNYQQMVFTHRISRDLSGANIPQFDFSAGTGLDYIDAYTYYGLFSPFTLLYALIPYSATIYAMPFIMVLKFGVCSLSAYIYISRFCKTKEFALAGALLYSYSGALLVNLVLPFLDAMAFFPLMPAALEAAINEKRRGVFGAAVFLCAITQYYIFGMEAIFIALYFFMGIISKHLRVSFRDVLCLTLETVLGLLAAGAAFIPAVICMINSPRLGEPFHDLKDMLVYDSPWRYPRLIQAIFMFPELQGYANIFPDSNGSAYPFGSLWSSQGMYLPMFGASGVIAYMTARKKNFFSAILALLMLIAFVPVLNSIFSVGSSVYYARWMFMAVLIMSAMTACALDGEPKYFKAGIITQISVTLLIMLFCILFPIEKISLWTMGYYNYIDLWIGIILTLGGALLAGVMIFRMKSHDSYKGMIIVMTAAFSFAASEAMLFFGMSDTSCPEVYTDLFSDTDAYPELDNITDSGRIVNCSTLQNMEILWERPSPYCFTSICNPYVSEYCDAVGITFEQIPDSYPSLCLMSVKESIKYAPYPEEDYSALHPSPKEAYEYAGNDLPYVFFENKNFIPMGFCYDYCISDEKLLSLDKEVRERIMLKAMSVEDTAAVSDYLDPVPEEEIYVLDDKEFAEECSKRAGKTVSGYYTDDDSYNAETDFSEPELVFFSIAYYDGFTAYVDGEEVPIIKANLGFQAIPVPAGKHTIKCVYHSKWRDIGAVCSAAGITGFAVYLIICRIIRKKTAE